MKKQIFILLGIVLTLVNCSFNCEPTYNQFSIRSDGTILKNNEAFFPIGFYIDRGTTDSYKLAVKQIADAGDFNIVNLPYNRDSLNWGSFLNLCYQKGIYVVGQMYYDNEFLGQVKLFKEHPAIYGWSIADDADNGHFTVEQLETRHEAAKSLDPYHVTESSLTGYYLKRRVLADTFTKIADVCCYQCYPITPLPDYDVTSENALTEAYLRILHYVKSAEKVNKPMIFNSQSFAWSDNAPELDARIPSVEESRNMMYSAFAAGVKGIISYAFNDVYECPEIWEEYVALCQDVKVLEGPMLNGQLTRVESEDKELVQSYWEYNGKYYIVVVNTSYSDTKNLALAIPTSKGANLKPIADRIKPTLTLFNGNLSGHLPPMSAQAFIIEQ